MALRLLPIARPCSEAYSAMHGDARRPFCDSCEKHVHDLSAGTEEEAREILRASQGKRICVRFAKNENGSVRFRTAAFAAAAAISLTACGSHGAELPVQDPSSIDHDMGDMVPDAIDKCPDEPGMLPDGGQNVNDDDGCPSANAADGGTGR